MSTNPRLRQYGLMGTLSRAVKYLLRFLGIKYEGYYLMANQLSDKDLSLQDINLNVKNLDINDFRAGDPRVFNESKIDFIKEKLSNKHNHSYGILDQGNLIYSTWISSGEIVFKSPVNKTIQVLPNQAIFEDSYCHPDFRGNGFHSKMNLYRLKKAKEMGFTKAIVIIVTENIPALKTQLKSGFKIEKKIWLLNIFGRQYYIERDIE